MDGAAMGRRFDDLAERLHACKLEILEMMPFLSNKLFRDIAGDTAAELDIAVEEFIGIACSFTHPCNPRRRATSAVSDEPTIVNRDAAVNR
jgi:hypothetical protein